MIGIYKYEKLEEPHPENLPQKYLFQKRANLSTMQRYLLIF